MWQRINAQVIELSQGTIELSQAKLYRFIFYNVEWEPNEIL